MEWDQVTDKLGIFGERVGKGLKRVFGSRNERFVRTLEPIVKRVGELESWAKGLSADDFKAKTAEYRKAVQAKERSLDDVLPEAFALVREASRRTLGLRPYDVQIVGGVVLHRGSIAEMMTGEGKTLVATLPLYLNALTGRSCFLVTVNDYLARRDAAWMGPIFHYLGMTVGAIQQPMHAAERQPIYACDIVYGTNSEFGFDYLRDNMKTRAQDQVQKDLYYAIVDEVDSILIDEARTPLIISGPAELSSDKYKLADRIARQLVKDEHYEVKEKERTASLLEAGIEAAEQMVGVPSFYTPGNEDWPHYIENAVKAHAIYHLDKEYVVEAGDHGMEVVIVDEFTGRKMPGRRWSDGLHQAVEVKEGLEPRQENQTLATITYQNYFRMFEKLAGMTGTALTEAGEFDKIYKLDVVSIPTNEPLAREDAHDVIYRTEQEKWKAICEEIERLQEKGQPVLVGTTSVEKSELLSGMLKRRGIEHEVLNAKNHEREAHIVAMAGDRGSVTVSTNMAGRGTDIKLGGNFEYRLKKALTEAGLVEGDIERLEEIDRIRAEVRAKCDADEKDVLARGGLYVLGTERHEARRIDNQLRGRSGRQGNVGESRFFLSLQDDLMRIFYRDWVTNFMEKLGMSEGQPIESGMVTRAVERAQKKVEDRNFEIRKHLLEYDEVMDHQRKAIYAERQKVLEGRDTKETVLAMFDRAVERARRTFLEDAEGLQGWFLRAFGFELPLDVAQAAVDPESGNSDALVKLLEERYEAREQEYGAELMRRLEAYILLESIDTRWKDHLHAIDALKAGIGLRSYGQVDPKNEYKREGAELFLKLFESVEDQVTSLMLRIQIAQRPPTAPAASGAAPQPGAAPLQPRGMYAGAAGAAGAASQRRRPPAIPATRAFDVMRRRQVVQEAIEARRQTPPTAVAEAAAPQAGAQATPQAAAQVGSAPPPDASAPSASAPPVDAGPAPDAGPATDEGPQAALAPLSLSPDELAKLGRNDACPCGSGKKYKKCHGSAT